MFLGMQQDPNMFHLPIRILKGLKIRLGKLVENFSFFFGKRLPEDVESRHFFRNFSLKKLKVVVVCHFFYFSWPAVNRLRWTPSVSSPDIVDVV